MGTNLPSKTNLERADFPALQSAQDILPVLRENLGGEEMAAWDFPRIKMPIGNMTTWAIPDIDGEKPAEQFTGLIVAWRRVRFYWASNVPTGMPPSCTSLDGVKGVGDPGGNCATCPFAQFGSATTPDGRQGRGQACKECRELWVLLPGWSLPAILVAPPTSAKEIKRYMAQLTARGLPYWAVVTKFETQRAQNADGQPYSRLKLSFVGVLPDEQRAVAERYNKAIQGMMREAPVASDAYMPEGNNEDGGS